MTAALVDTDASEASPMLQEEPARFYKERRMRELTFNEVEDVAGASEWGDNVLTYGSGVAFLGSFGGPKGAAAGFLIGAAIGTVITLIN